MSEEIKNGMPGKPQETRQKSELDDILRPFDRITNYIELPSQGLPYGGRMQDGKILVTPITAQEESMLAGATGEPAGVIEAIIKRCVVECPIPVDELISQDRFFIVLMLRVNSYGSAYDFKVKCDGCNLQFVHCADILTDLEIKNLDPETFEEPYRVKLPMCKKEARIRYLRGTDEAAVAKYARQHYAKTGKNVPKSDYDPSYTYRLAKQIVEVNGRDVTSPADWGKLLEWVRSLPGADISAIKEANEEHDCGFDTRMDITCPRCGNVNERVLPFTAEFFRTSKERDTGS